MALSAHCKFVSDHLKTEVCVCVIDRTLLSKYLFRLFVCFFAQEGEDNCRHLDVSTHRSCVHVSKTGSLEGLQSLITSSETNGTLWQRRSKERYSWVRGADSAEMSNWSSTTQLAKQRLCVFASFTVLPSGIGKAIVVTIRITKLIEGVLKSGVFGRVAVDQNQKSVQTFCD